MPRTLATPSPLAANLSTRPHCTEEETGEDFDAPYRAGEIVAAVAATAGATLLIWYGTLVLELLAGVVSG